VEPSDSNTSERSPTSHGFPHVLVSFAHAYANTLMWSGVWKWVYCAGALFRMNSTSDIARLLCSPKSPCLFKSSLIEQDRYTFLRRPLDFM